MTAELDDATAAYVVVAQVCFEDLKQVAGQLAGFLVLQAAGSSVARPDHPALKAAELVYRHAEDGLKSARIPAQARAHHEHLLAAASRLKAALSLAGKCRDFLPLIQNADAELRAASRALPGFQMISFERGCCA
jgi:hypothetical protein